ncbi:hypothetical protein NEIPOLOT_01837 [Neisseria polysaccharea ATCC 43768]|nr:hypothetical protein NEIPOLOT_01837 [Neisseria polysaccharea ATCC 43768]
MRIIAESVPTLYFALRKHADGKGACLPYAFIKFQTDAPGFQYARARCRLVRRHQRQRPIFRGTSALGIFNE